MAHGVYELVADNRTASMRCVRQYTEKKRFQIMTETDILSDVEECLVASSRASNQLHSWSDDGVINNLEWTCNFTYSVHSRDGLIGGSFLLLFRAALFNIIHIAFHHTLSAVTINSHSSFTCIFCSSLINTLLFSWLRRCKNGILTCLLSYVLTFWTTVLSVMSLARCVVCLSVCRLSVTFCIVAKRYILAKNYLKEWIGNQVKKLIFSVAAVFLLPVSALRPPTRPFLPYFFPYSPAIGTRWYKLTF